MCLMIQRKINCGSAGHGYNNCETSFSVSAYLLKNAMRLMKLWCHSRENLNYVPAKPHKWGFKMWGQRGFLYDFDVCQGAQNPDREKSEVGVTGEVVLKMTSTLPAEKNHKVFADKFMGGIDFLDMLSALYKFSFRSRGWYMYIWRHTVTVAVINSWNLYRRDQKKLEPQMKPMGLRRFQALAGTTLTSAGKTKIKCGRPLSSPEAAATPSRKRPSCSVPLDVRRDDIDHFPTWETRQRCKHCIGNHFSHVYCEKCKVHLCLNKERNYHRVK